MSVWTKLQQKNSSPAVYSGSPVLHCHGENLKYAQEKKKIPGFLVQTFVEHLLWQEPWQSNCHEMEEDCSYLFLASIEWEQH